jgi:hypothetical protein
MSNNQKDERGHMPCWEAGQAGRTRFASERRYHSWSERVPPPLLNQKYLILPERKFSACAEISARRKICRTISILASLRPRGRTQGGAFRRSCAWKIKDGLEPRSLRRDRENSLRVDLSWR